MSYAALDAARLAKACKNALITLEASDEKSEAHQRKTLMIQRMGALAMAAAECKHGTPVITLTSEEFWLISQNW
ncbi:hypothetical protein IFJ82_15345 [Novacetimonas hansenii]|uniref:Uncharacterized protein n=2 Tax=Novacetimonas hansenii TaxID=436 RepID=A0AAW5ERR1_NOVHA|nr:hypothetical protein [Novacetimonas hansenii]EFG85602.1 hypothetical protein GXY_02046 [Novacetimonas hansenii ATCC 23769]MBL7236302.1 hypothetical protein [Novacetimonas hansenii]MCJ8353841.1 hypothetical protein [Novacetimonas hansenii]PYD72078.1 hypothetical protein CFR74_11435 [Novacetimonas hansenii]QOF95138.1 hypothetical protein IFJ82_15345 [Novacetimonas hansenii]